MVESITAINGLLLNLFPQYPNMRTDYLNWTTINIGKEIIRFFAKRGDIESNFPGSRNLSDNTALSRGCL